MIELADTQTKARMPDIESGLTEQFQIIPTDQAHETLAWFFGEFGALTEQGCLTVGDALLSLKTKLTPLEYHRTLKKLRVTPVAAWDYETISRNNLLRAKLTDSERPARPEELAILAKFPDTDLSAVLEKNEGTSSEGYKFMRDTISQMRDDVIMNAGTRFGWPRIAIRPGETWSVTVIPTKIGVQGSFFTRVGLHGQGKSSEICPRTTDTRLGGNPASACALCDEAADRKPYGEPEAGYCDPVPHWAVFCTVVHISDGDGLRVYSYDETEPFLLIVNDEMLDSIVSASLNRTKGYSFFSSIHLSLHDGLHLICSSYEPAYCMDTIQKWSERLREPGELRVAARECSVYPLGMEQP